MKFLFVAFFFCIANAIPSRLLAAEEQQYFQSHGLSPQAIEILTAAKDTKEPATVGHITEALLKNVYYIRCNDINHNVPTSPVTSDTELLQTRAVFMNLQILIYFLLSKPLHLSLQTPARMKFSVVCNKQKTRAVYFFNNENKLS